jgi:hypothetical protein
MVGWSIIGELLQSVAVSLLVLAPGAAWLFKVRPREPRFWIALLLPLLWLAPFLAAWVWILYSLPQSHAEAPWLVFVPVIAQVVFSIGLIVRLKRVWLPVAVWAAVNIPFGLMSTMFVGMTVTGLHF